MDGWRNRRGGAWVSHAVSLSPSLVFPRWDMGRFAGRSRQSHPVFRKPSIVPRSGPCRQRRRPRVNIATAERNRFIAPTVYQKPPGRVKRVLPFSPCAYQPSRPEWPSFSSRPDSGTRDSLIFLARPFDKTGGDEDSHEDREKSEDAAFHAPGLSTRNRGVKPNHALQPP